MSDSICHPSPPLESTPAEVAGRSHATAVALAHAEISRGVRLLTKVFPAGVFSNLDLRIRIELSSRGLWYEGPHENRSAQTVTLLEEDLRRSAQEILILLLHQMVHAADFARGVEDLYPSGFHNLQFKLSAEEVGLDVVVTDVRRGRVKLAPGVELERCRNVWQLACR